MEIQVLKPLNADPSQGVSIFLAGSIENPGSGEFIKVNLPDGSKK